MRGDAVKNFAKKFSHRIPSKNFKKTLDIVVRQWYNVSTSAKGIFCCTRLCQAVKPCDNSKISLISHKKRDILRHEGGTQAALSSQIKYNGRCRKLWLMKQESRLLWYAQNASREITTQRRTRRTTLTDSNSTSSANSATSTLFTKNPNNWGRK